jgi:hypothetical protein
MWSAYSGQGVAIQSTVERLFLSTREHQPLVDIREVFYVNHGTDEISEPDAFLYKHRMYRHEEEIRAFVRKHPDDPDDTTGESNPSYLLVPCHLDTLIEVVHLAPGSGAWFFEVVESILDRFGLPGVSVRFSEADIIPEYRRRLEEFRDRPGH